MYPMEQKTERFAYNAFFVEHYVSAMTGAVKE